MHTLSLGTTVHHAPSKQHRWHDVVLSEHSDRAESLNKFMIFCGTNSPHKRWNKDTSRLVVCRHRLKKGELSPYMYTECGDWHSFWNFYVQIEWSLGRISLLLLVVAQQNAYFALLVFALWVLLSVTFQNTSPWWWHKGWLQHTQWALYTVSLLLNAHAHLPATDQLHYTYFGHGYLPIHGAYKQFMQPQVWWRLTLRKTLLSLWQ
jgi:hypothetical protein